MKRNFRSTMLVILFFAAFAMSGAPTAQAQDEGGCSNATAAGQWGFTTAGTVFLSSGPVPAVVVGRFKLDAAGNLAGTQTRSLNGLPVNRETILGINSYLDMVYRLPTRQSERPVPVGVVSKNYRLLDHHQTLRTIQQAMANRKLDLENVRVVGEWTIHGERAHFSIVFPPEELFTVGTAGNEDEMRFRIEVFNSVDGSCRLMAIAGWLRFVCTNGLIIGAALLQLQQQHRQQLEVEELGRRVGEAIESAQSDKATFTQWMSTRVDESALVPWIDEEVRSLWGVKAAVRTLRIAIDGWDVEPVGDMRNRRPSEIRTNRVSEVPVPGVDAPVRNLFGVSQVLSWIAGQRGEISEDLEWRSQVHDLIAKLDA